MAWGFSVSSFWSLEVGAACGLLVLIEEMCVVSILYVQQIYKKEPLWFEDLRKRFHEIFWGLQTMQFNIPFTFFVLCEFHSRGEMQLQNKAFPFGKINRKQFVIHSWIGTFFVTTTKTTFERSSALTKGSTKCKFTALLNITSSSQCLSGSPKIYFFLRKSQNFSDRPLLKHS